VPLYKPPHDRFPRTRSTLYYKGSQGNDMITDDTQTAQLRRTIINSVDNYDLQLLKRIAYECRCEEMGIHPDGKFLYTDID